MKNNFGAYLAGAKTARALAVQAHEAAAKGDLPRAVRQLCMAVQELVVANNNLASIAFKKKPKARRPAADTPASVAKKMDHVGVVLNALRKHLPDSITGEEVQ